MKIVKNNQLLLSLLSMYLLRQSLALAQTQNRPTQVYYCQAECFAQNGDGSYYDAGQIKKHSYVSVEDAFQRVSEGCTSPDLLVKRQIRSLDWVDSFESGMTLSYTLSRIGYYSRSQGRIHSYTLRSPQLRAQFKIEAATLKNSCQSSSIEDAPSVEDAWGKPIGG